jgi:hypothetical protein
MAQGAARRLAWSRRWFLVGPSSFVEFEVDPCGSSDPLCSKDVAVPNTAQSSLSINDLL